MDPLRDARGVGLAADVLEQDRELVAAEPREGVAGAQAGLEPPGELHEEIVSREVPHAVVDALEAVEVEEDDGEEEVARAAPLRPPKEVLEAIHEERPVRQLRQGVVERLMREARLDLLSLADVA